jgi:chromosome segregation ATPase
MFSATLREWKRKIEQLRQRWRAVRQENERLRKEIEALRRREKQLERERERLEQERERLREENDRLRRQLEEAQRANKRQAAPFSRGTRKEHPARGLRSDRVAISAGNRAQDHLATLRYRHRPL